MVSGSNTAGPRRWVLIVSTLVPVIFLVGVLVVAKMRMGTDVDAPLSLSPLPAPQTPTASSPQCRDLVAALPDDLPKARRVDVHVEGVPTRPGEGLEAGDAAAGTTDTLDAPDAPDAPDARQLTQESTAAWRWTDSGLAPADATDDLTAITLRCGVTLPDSFQLDSALEQINGVQWFRAEGPELRTGYRQVTLYAVDRGQVPVAVTVTDRAVMSVIQAISDAVSGTLPVAPVDAPGGTVAMPAGGEGEPAGPGGAVATKDAAAGSRACRSLHGSLPDTVTTTAASSAGSARSGHGGSDSASGRVELSRAAVPEDSAPATFAWQDDSGHLVATLRCGAGDPDAGSVTATYYSASGLRWRLLNTPYPLVPQRTWVSETGTASAPRVTVTLPATITSAAVLRGEAPTDDATGADLEAQHHLLDQISAGMH